MLDAGVADTMEAMTASLVYLLLRQVLQMLTQLPRNGGAKDVEIPVLRHQVSGATPTGAPPRPATGRPGVLACGVTPPAAISPRYSAPPVACLNSKARPVPPTRPATSKPS